VRGSVSDWGTVDGEPAKIVYIPGSRKKDIYWGGRGAPDGPGHNHAVVMDSNPDAATFVRIDGRIVADKRYPENEGRWARGVRAQGGYSGIFMTALRRALRMYFR
jgi:serine acetyltransferase